MPKTDFLDQYAMTLAASDLADYREGFSKSKNEGSIFRGETFPSLEWRESSSGVSLPSLVRRGSPSGVPSPPMSGESPSGVPIPPPIP